MLGEKLTEVRKSKGLKREDLARKLKTSYETIRRWEKNIVDIPVTKFNKICEILDIPPSILLGEEPTTIEYPFEVITSKKKIDIKEIMPTGTNYILVNVKDEGVKCLGIINGDQAIVDTNDKQPHNGSIYALSLGNGVILRKTKQSRNEIIIVSCDFKNCEISIYHKSEVDIIGKVVRIVRKL